MSIVASLIGFNLLILIHELGHFVAGRLVGLRAECVSVGFGPAVLSWVTPGTEYRLGCLPIGGYVRFPNARFTKPRFAVIDGAGLDGLSHWARCFVTLAGPLANVILAVCVYASLFAADVAVVYQFQREQTTQLGSVNDEVIRMGFKAGDVVVGVDGRAVRSFSQLQQALINANGSVSVDVARPSASSKTNYETLKTRVEGLVLKWPIASKSDRSISLTIAGDREVQAFIAGVRPTVGRFGTTSTWHAFVFGADETLWVLRAMRRLVQHWRDGTRAPEVRSVIKMTQLSARSYEQGWAWFFSLMALFSMNLAVLNLLPLPGLDGGRLLMDVLEWASGRTLDGRITLIVHGLGMMLLIIFLLVVMVREAFDLIQ